MSASQEALKKFEQGQSSLQEFFPEFLQGIRWEIEKTRPEIISRLRAELASRHSRRQARAEAERESDEELRGLLANANESLLAKQFNKAEELLSQVLERDPNNAGALYGLAQIAGQNQDLQRALELYERAALNAASRSGSQPGALCAAGTSSISNGTWPGPEASGPGSWICRGTSAGAREEASKALATK